MGVQATRPTVGVALTGGEYRAASYTLRAPLYLIDAVGGPSLTSITSVSSESFINGFVGDTTGLRSIEQSECVLGQSGSHPRIAARGAVFPSPSVSWHCSIGWPLPATTDRHRREIA